MAEKTQNPPKRESTFQDRRQFINNCRNSKIIEPATLTEVVMRIYRLRFREISRSAYLARFYCSVGRGLGFDVEQKVTKEMITIIGDVKTSIDKKIAIADQLIKNSGITIGEAKYESVNVTIIDPIAKIFLNTLKSASELEEKLRVLWLDCKLEDTEKRQALSEIEKEFNEAHQRCLALMIGVRNRFNDLRLAREGADKSTADELVASEIEIISEVEEVADGSLEDYSKMSNQELADKATTNLTSESKPETA